MKWGIRRYQNTDGTLTDEGKKRAQKSGSNYDIPKGATLYRAVRNGSTKFMDREYTYVNNTDKLSEHSYETSSGFGGEFDKNVRMTTTKKLRIASPDDYYDALFKANHINPKKYLNDIPDEVIEKGKTAILSSLPYQMVLGDYGLSSTFNKTVKYLKKKGYDGVIDPADGISQLNEGKKPIATVLFDPGKNVKIEEITDFY